jgi:protein involved in polysaccharide export with SLBB domain
MNDEPIPRSSRRSWPQISLSTLLAFVLGIGVGLVVKYQFGETAHRLPSPAAIRLGDKLTIEVGPGEYIPESKRTALVLADGTITLPKLGQVPAVGLSLDDLTVDLKERYGIYYGQAYRTKPLQVPVLVSFADSSVGN